MKLTAWLLCQLLPQATLVDQLTALAPAVDRSHSGRRRPPDL